MKKPSAKLQIKRKLRQSCEEPLWLTSIRLENLSRQFILRFQDWNDRFILPLVLREDDDNTGAVVYDGNSLPVTICFHVYELGLNIAKICLISGHFYYI